MTRISPLLALLVLLLCLFASAASAHQLELILAPSRHGDGRIIDDLDGVQ